MKKEEISWILYDVANSAFVLIVMTILMPIFFKEYAAAGLTNAESTAWLGYASSFSSLVIALTSPVLGAIADYKGKKMRMFLPFFITGIIFTFLLVTIEPGDWKYCLVIFMVARTAWYGTLVF
jgi:UMF1 family MFS transporter